MREMNEGGEERLNIPDEELRKLADGLRGKWNSGTSASTEEEEDEAVKELFVA